MNRFYIILFASWFFISCNSDSYIKFSVQNKSRKTINHATLYVESNKKQEIGTFSTIKPDESSTIRWKIDRNINTDGIFSIQVVFIDNTNLDKEFGYFSNGYHFLKSYFLELLSDGIRISSPEEDYE